MSDTYSLLHNLSTPLGHDAPLPPSSASALQPQEDVGRDVPASLACPAYKHGLAPISMLPAEVLGCIFAYCVPQDYQDLEDYVYDIQFLAVCKAWRAVALEHPSLWSFIQCIDLALTRLLLQRSKAAPLDVHLEDGDLKSLLLALRHLERIRTLELDFISDNMESSEFEDIMNALACPAPNLVSSQFVGDDYLPLPDKLFNLYTPRLRSLSFRECLFDWRILTAPSVVGSLTSLEIRTCMSTVHFTAYEFCSALNLMLSLITLNIDLRPNIPQGFVGSHEVNQMVSMPNLEQFIINGPSVDISAIMRQLSIPQSAKLDISFALTIDESRFLPDLSAAVELLGRHGVGSPSTGNLRKVVVDESYWSRRCALRGLMKDHDGKYTKPLLSVALSEVSIGPRTSAKHHARLLRHLVLSVCNAIWQKTIKVVEMGLDVADPQMCDTLRRALHRASEVHTLRLRGQHAAMHFMDALVPVPAKEGEEAGVLFPHLAKLSLACKFRQPSTDSADLADSEMSQLCQLLSDVLKGRKESTSVGAVDVHIKQSSVGTENVKGLREDLEGCATVRWDGKTVWA